MSTPNNNNPPMTPEVANQIMLRRSLHYRRNTRPVSPLARSNRLQAIRGDLAQQFPAIHQLRSHAATLQLELEELRTANANNASDNFAQRGALEQRLTTATRNHRAAEEALAPLRRQLATAQAEAVTAQQQLTTAEQQADPDLRAHRATHVCRIKKVEKKRREDARREDAGRRPRTPRAPRARRAAAAPQVVSIASTRSGRGTRGSHRGPYDFGVRSRR
ncbi:hypothetical protein MMC10_000221 [Thelotrema lepadinum]|nr:hypothetical protein [Thelotrema lepadinum]